MAAQDRKKRRRFPARSFPLAYLFPNIITLAGLCVSLSAIRWAMVDRFELSVAFILLAALIDGMDGRLARMLNATSTFGAHLDSLSDFVSFGVVPALVIYMWQLENVRGYGWMVLLFFAVCTALRLARFNTTHIFDTPPPSKEEPERYFTGVPAPAGAMLCILPLVLSFEFGTGQWFDTPHFNLFYLPFVALLMASTLPTFSAKKIKINSTMVVPVMVLSGVFIGGCIIEPWLTFIIIAIAYLVLIPVSGYFYHKEQKNA